jgi:hypothetical protein
MINTSFWTEFMITSSLLYAEVYGWKLCNLIYRYIHKMCARICACGFVRVCLYLKFLESLKCSLHKSILLIFMADYTSLRTKLNPRNYKTEWSLWCHEIRAITATFPAVVKYLQVSRKLVSHFIRQQYSRALEQYVDIKLTFWN